MRYNYMLHRWLSIIKNKRLEMLKIRKKCSSKNYQHAIINEFQLHVAQIMVVN